MSNTLVWVFAAAELQGDLHVIGEEVVEVLHPPIQGVPVSPVGDAVTEEPPAMEDMEDDHWPLTVGSAHLVHRLWFSMVR